MGIHLSSNGGLTLSQKQSCGGNKAEEAKLLKKLSSHPINQKLLGDIANRAADRAKLVRERSQETTPSKNKGNTRASFR